MSDAVWPPEAGASGGSLSGLTDTQFSAVSDQDRIEFDVATGKWVNLKSFALDTGEPQGVIDTSETTLSVSVSAGAGGTLTVARTGTEFSHYIKGKKYGIGVDQVFNIPASTGLYYCYYDDTNTPQISIAPWSILDDVPYSIVYYNNTTGDYFLGDERHGCTMSAATHLRLHFGGGAVYYSGLSATGYTLDSDALADVQIEVDAGSFGDEDITLSLALKAKGDDWDKWYRDGVAGDWRKSATDTIPAIHSLNVPKINQDPGGGWQLTDVANNSYFNYYIMGTNSYENTNRYMLIPGQNYYSDSADAEQESISSLDFGALPTVELIPIYKVRMRYRTINSANDARVTLVEVEDLRGTSNPGISATGVTHNALGGRADADAHPTAAISYAAASTGVTSITNLSDYLSIDESAGVISGLSVIGTTPATPSVSLSAGDIHLRSLDTKFAPLGLYNIGSSVNTLVDESINYIFADYNGGSPQTSVTQDLTTITAQSKVAIAVAASVHGDIHHIEIGDYTVDFMAEYARKESVTNWLKHGSGAELSEQGTLGIGLTAGSFYIINKRFTTSSFDTSGADTFGYYSTSDSGATWTFTAGQNQIDVLQYNDISSGLVALGNNKFGVHWVYLVVDSPDELNVVYGHHEYDNLSEAQAATVPTVLPPGLGAYGVAALVGKIIIQKSGTSFSDIQSPFDTIFRSSTPTNHNRLAGLQGGTLDEYYHLTAAQHTNLIGGAPSFATSVSSPLFDSTGATLNIGTVTADTINIGKPGGTVNIFGAANNINATDVFVPNDLVIDGNLLSDGGIDTSVAIPLEIGSTNTSSVNISTFGTPTVVRGGLTVIETASFSDDVYATNGFYSNVFRAQVAADVSYRNSAGTEVGKRSEAGSYAFGATDYSGSHTANCTTFTIDGGGNASITTLLLENDTPGAINRCFIDSVAAANDAYFLTRANGVLWSAGIDASDGSAWKLVAGGSPSSGTEAIRASTNGACIIGATSTPSTHRIQTALSAQISYGKSASGAGWGYIGADSTNAFRVWTGGTGANPSLGTSLITCNHTGALTVGTTTSGNTNLFRGTSSFRIYRADTSANCAELRFQSAGGVREFWQQGQSSSYYFGSSAATVAGSYDTSGNWDFRGQLDVTYSSTNVTLPCIKMDRSGIASSATSVTQVQFFQSGAACGAILSQGTGSGPNFVSSSDRRIKRDIKDANDDWFMPLFDVRLRTYKIKKHGAKSQDKYGVIAQELLRQFPRKVFKNYDGMYNVSTDYTYELIGAVQYVKSKLDKVSSHNDVLIKKLIKRIDELELKNNA